MHNNTFMIFALLIVLILFCMTRSEGFIMVPDGFATRRLMPPRNM